MDIHLPNISGIECTARLKETLPDADVIMLTVYEDNDKIFRALQAGACGYLLKRTPPEQLIQAIKDVKQGGAPMTSEVARRLVETFQRTTANPPQEHVELSRREREILEIVFQLEEASVADVIARMASPPAYDSVRTMLRLLERKGFVKHRQDGTKYVYRPTQRKSSASRSALSHLMATFFENSVADTVAAALDLKSDDLSQEELDKLQELIDNARKEGR